MAALTSLTAAASRVADRLGGGPGARANAVAATVDESADAGRELRVRLVLDTLDGGSLVLFRRFLRAWCSLQPAATIEVDLGRLGADGAVDLCGAVTGQVRRAHAHGARIVVLRPPARMKTELLTTGVVVRRYTAVRDPRAGTVVIHLPGGGSPAPASGRRDEATTVETA